MCVFASVFRKKNFIARVCVTSFLVLSFLMPGVGWSIPGDKDQSSTAKTTGGYVRRQASLAAESAIRRQSLDDGISASATQIQSHSPKTCAQKQAVIEEKRAQDVHTQEGRSNKSSAENAGSVSVTLADSGTDSTQEARAAFTPLGNACSVDSRDSTPLTARTTPVRLAPQNRQGSAHGEATPATRGSIQDVPPLMYINPTPRMTLEEVPSRILFLEAQYHALHNQQAGLTQDWSALTDTHSVQQKETASEVTALKRLIAERGNTQQQGAPSEVTALKALFEEKLQQLEAGMTVKMAAQKTETEKALNVQKKVIKKTAKAHKAVIDRTLKEHQAIVKALEEDNEKLRARLKAQEQDLKKLHNRADRHMLRLREYKNRIDNGLKARTEQKKESKKLQEALDPISDQQQDLLRWREEQEAAIKNLQTDTVVLTRKVETHAHHSPALVKAKKERETLNQKITELTRQQAAQGGNQQGYSAQEVYRYASNTNYVIRNFYKFLQDIDRKVERHRKVALPVVFGAIGILNRLHQSASGHITERIVWACAPQLTQKGRTIGKEAWNSVERANVRSTLPPLLQNLGINRETSRAPATSTRSSRAPATAPRAQTTSPTRAPTTSTASSTQPTPTAPTFAQGANALPQLPSLSTPGSTSPRAGARRSSPSTETSDPKRRRVSGPSVRDNQRESASVISSTSPTQGRPEVRAEMPSETPRETSLDIRENAGGQSEAAALSSSDLEDGSIIPKSRVVL